MKFIHQVLAGVASIIVLSTVPVSAEITLDGYFECARATNGRPYCKKLGQGDRYFPVSDSFLVRYIDEVSHVQSASQPTITTTTSTTNVSNSVLVALTNDAADIRGLVTLFQGMIDEQNKITAPKDSDVAQQTIAVLATRIRDLEGQFKEKSTQLSAYKTTIRPNDADLQISARRASELFPKIPYYIPGTPDTGEFWLEPTVSNVGELIFNLKFIDPNSEDRVREVIELTSAQLELTRDALRKVVDWSKTAHDKAIRKDFSRRAICFPQQDCAAEDAPKIEKVASTEIVFRVYENGSTAGRVQHNKGRYESGYNISIESSLLLQAYLNHVLLEGKKEFDAGSRNAAQLRDMFK